MIQKVKDLVHFIYDVQGLIEWGGLTMVCAIVFVETGFFFGFFLPGDSLLVSAGIFARMGLLNIYWLLTLVPACAIVGDQLNYLVGRKAGQALYQREDSMFFKKKHLIRTHDFYEKYGAKTIVIARFVPIVRTFAPAVAGVALMDYSKFVTYNIVGGILWGLSMVLTGYTLASMIPHVEKRIHLVIMIVIFLSILPGIIEFYREWRKGKSAAAA